MEQNEPSTHLFAAYKCQECGFEGDVEIINKTVTCPTCGTVNDVWQDGETPPQNHGNEPSAGEIVRALRCVAEAIECKDCRYKYPVGNVILCDHEQMNGNAADRLEAQEHTISILKDNQYESWRSAKRPPARGEVVSVTVLEDSDRYECEAYIHEVSGRWVYPTSSGTSIAGQVIAWRPKAAPYMGEFSDGQE